jgi:hypothetical protein
VAGDVTGYQLPLVFPTLVLLGVILIRPVKPVEAAKNARRAVFAVGVGLGAALFGEHRELASFPVVLDHGASSLLRNVNDRVGENFAWVALAAVPVALFLGEVIVQRACYVLPAGSTPFRTLVKTLLVLLVVVGFLVRPASEVLDRPIPGLPGPNETWWTL